VISKKSGGIFKSAFEDLGNKPRNFWLSPFKVILMSESGQNESGYGDGVRR
jgi:hypothetical protein